MAEQTTETKKDQDTAVDLADYSIILWKWRKIILVTAITVAFVTLVISLVLPKWYKATASILPPKDQGLLSQLGGVGSLLKEFSPLQKISGMGQNSGSYNYLAILKSRTAMEDVVRKFDLIAVYNISDTSMEKAITELEDNVTFKVEDEDYISITVLDKNPRRAADIANYFTVVLNSISNRLGTQEGRENREFIERRLGSGREDLRRAEEALKQYQEKTGTMFVPDQSGSSISAVAELYGEKAKKEVELAILRQRTTPDNPTVQQLEIEVRELDKKLSTFPETGLESIRLYRNVLVQQKIIEFLTPLYEQAKIDEQKDVPVILVLDEAVPPEKKAKPQRTLLILGATAGSLLITIFVILSYESLRRSSVLLALKRGRFRTNAPPIRD